MEQQLKDAAVAGDIDAFCALISRDPNILETINKKPLVDTPLHQAASHGQTHFASFVMELMPSFIRKRNETDRFTPLHVAVQCGKTETALQLLDIIHGGNGDTVRVKGKGGMTPLHCAVQQGSVELLLKFLSACPKAIEDVTVRNETCLHLALKNHKLDAFKALVGWIEIGYDEGPSWEERILNMKDDQDRTILDLATSQQLNQAVETLVARRLAKYFDPLPVAIPTQQSESPVSFLNNYTHLLRIDRKLNKAAYDGDTNAIYSILRENERILDNIAAAPFVDTPLHIAASEGHIRFFKEIMLLKPSLAEKLNQDGYSPLHLAIQNNQLELARGLVREYKKLASVKGKYGMTPFHYAVKMGNEELVAEFLIASPESYSDLTVSKENAIHIAVRHSELAILKVFFRWNRLLGNAKYSALNLANDEGITPMDIADRQKNPEIIQFLRKMGARSKSRRGRENSILFKMYWCLIKNSLAVDRSVIVRRLLRDSFIAFKTQITEVSLEERNIILVVCTLVATTTYQAVLSPPGGVWQGDVSLLFPANQSSITDRKERDQMYNLLGTTVLSTGVWAVFATLNTLAFVLSVTQICIVLWGTPSMLLVVAIFWAFCYAMALYVVSSGNILPVVLSSLMFFCLLRGFLDMSPVTRLKNSTKIRMWISSIFIGLSMYIVYVRTSS